DDQVACAHVRAEDLGSFLQRPVTNLVPVIVVDALEMVEVEHDDRDRCARSYGRLHELGGVELQSSSVEYPRQRVGYRPVAPARVLEGAVEPVGELWRHRVQQVDV